MNHQYCVLETTKSAVLAEHADQGKPPWVGDLRPCGISRHSIRRSMRLLRRELYSTLP